MNVDSRTGEPVYRIGIDDRLPPGRFAFCNGDGHVVAYGGLDRIAADTAIVLMSPSDYADLFEAADAAGVMVPAEFARRLQ